MRKVFSLIVFSVVLSAFASKAKAVDVPVYVAKLEGSASQLVVGAQATTNIYTNFPYSSFASVNRITNVVTFKIDEESLVHFSTAFTATITYKIYFEDANAVEDSTAVQTLTVNYDTSSTYRQRASFKFSGAYKARVKIVSITAPGAAIPALVLLNEMRVNAEFNFSCTTDTVSSLDTATAFTQADEVYVSWASLSGADEYDLEWAYVDSTALDNYRVSGNLSAELIYDANATRVTLSEVLFYKIPLLYDHGGVLFYRIRGIQNKADGSRVTGKWTWGLDYYGFYGHQRNLNWQATTSYAEDGKRKSVVQYFDGSLRGRQTVTKDNSTGTTIVAETFYDYQGRPVINVLPAPTLSTVIQYAQNFNVGLNGGEYDKGKYDTLINASAYCGNSADSMGIQSGAARYYSDSNSQAAIGFHKYIPNSNNYPFVETRYEQDNTGRIASQSGVGIQHKLGSGHETKYFYGLPSQKELDGLFGTEVGNYTHYQKNMVKDANGQYSVSYLDMKGRTIATALAGNQPAVMDSLPTKNTQTITDSIITPASNTTDGLSMIASKGLLVPKAGEHRFVYSLMPDSISIANCDTVNICYDCYYDLEITISNDCNNSGLPNNQPILIRRTNLTLDILNNLCIGRDSLSFAVDTTINLAEGSYLITKKLTVSRWAMEYYRDSVFLPNNTCKTKQDFIKEVLDSMRLQPSNCIPECASCISSVGTWTDFHGEYMEQSGYAVIDTAAHLNEAITAYKNALDVCDALCNTTGDDLSIRRTMLWDVSPSSGQYAYPDTDSLENAFSIFKTIGGTRKFANPLLTYLDENGYPDTVYVNGAPKLPWELSYDDFAARFKTSWAETLLQFHPEYCKLQKYEQYSVSHRWDKRFEAVETFRAAKDSGFLNPTGGFPHFSNGGSTDIIDPLFNNGYTYAGASIKTLMENWMRDYKLVGSNYLSMHALAAMTSACDKDETSCITTYSDTLNAFDSTALCQGELDMAWRSFRSFYLNKKRELLWNLIDSCAPVSFGHYQARFIDPGSFDPPSLDDVGSGTEDVISSAAATYVDNCEAYVAQWMHELLKCSSYDSTDLMDAVVPKLVQVCIKGSDPIHAYGSSTISPDSIYTFNSFEDVLQWYNDSLALDSPATNVCNAYLITAPKPYNQVTPLGEIPFWNRPDSCTCERIEELHQDYQSNYSFYSTFSAYLSEVHHTTISQGALDTLRGLCDSSITCNYLASPINLPAALQCGVTQTCIDCEQMRNGYAMFQRQFPGAIPKVDTAGSLSQTLINIVFANFLNAQFGFSYSTADYLAFMDDCKIGVSAYQDTLWKRIAEFRRFYKSTPRNQIWRTWKISSYTTTYINALNALISKYQNLPVPQGYAFRPPTFNDDQKLKAISYLPGGYWPDTNYHIIFPAPLQHTVNYSNSPYPGMTHLDNNIVKASDFVTGTATTEELNNKYFAVVTRTLPRCFQNIWSGTFLSPIVGYYYAVSTPDSNFVPGHEAGYYNWENHIQTVAFYRPGVSVVDPATYLDFYQDSVYIGVTTFWNFSTHTVELNQIKGIRDARFDPTMLPVSDMWQFDWNPLGIKVTLDLMDNTQTDAYIWSGYTHPYNRYKEYIDSSLYDPDCKTAFAYYFNQLDTTSYSIAQIDSIYLSYGISFNYCDSLADTTKMLCGKKELFDSFDPNSSNCIDSSNMAVVWGTELYNRYVDSLKDAFETAYLKKCLNAFNIESFTVTRPHSEYHYTLYYYDQAGNLVKTVPPAGVDNKIADAGFLSDVIQERTDGTVLTPSHTMETNYRYNTLNQVVSQKSPDGGTTYFWYDRLGRLVVSQNAKQETEDKYSYTLYDALGRITEVGEIYSETVMEDVISTSMVDLPGWIENGSKTQITRTTYDAANTLIEPELYQKNLRNRVASTEYVETDGDPYQSATFYSYDIHGNVDTLLQDYQVGLMNDHSNRFKKMVYRYDLISGKVNHVAYQPKQVDAFYHRYEYDAENKLTDVYTSRDSLHWEREASYSYYKHGPLARIELGQQRVQGLDYAYTLQGWLKGVNSSLLCEGTTDMGQDGFLESEQRRYVARDAFGFVLHYYDGDYRSIGQSKKFYGYANTVGERVSSHVSYRPLYNGNISSMSVNIGKLNMPAIYNYRYDQLNRLSGMEFLFLSNNCENHEAELWDYEASRDESYEERISYDPNGNILAYRRNANRNTSLDMDDLQYEYIPGTNKLDRIADNVNPGFDFDIDDQNTGNYNYDEIGNLIYDNQSHITNIEWTVYGKIKTIYKSGDPSGVEEIRYTYDAAGNRISKCVVNPSIADQWTWYVRDASGNVMAVYEPNDEIGGLALQEQHIYGSSRIGIEKPVLFAATEGSPGISMGSLGDVGYNVDFERGKKYYELTNHLGNVLVTLSDKKVQVDTDTDGEVDYYEAYVTGAQDYYPFGMLMPERQWSYGTGYRHGFNGKENDNEVKGTGNQQDYGMRIYDPRVGRFLSVDPLTKEFAWNSPYAFAENDVIRSIDLEGAERFIKIYDDTKKVINTFDAYDIEEGAHGKMGYGTIHMFTNKAIYEEDGKTAQFSVDDGVKKVEQMAYDILSDITGRVAYNLFTKGKINKAIERFTPAEKYVFRNDPVKSNSIKDIPDKALVIADQIGKTLGANTHNAPPDAIRHALWNIMMAKEEGADFAKKVSDAHEQDKPTQPLGEKLMDLHNNSVGLDIYKQNPGKSLQELYNILIDKTAAGGLQIYDPATKTSSKSSLKPDEVKKLKEIDVSKIKGNGQINNY